MLKNLSSKQQRVLDFYKSYIKEYNYSPTYQQAAEKLGISPSVVYSHMINLEKAWYIFRDSSGGVQLKSNKSTVPVLGKIACGTPIDIYEDNIEEIEIPSSMSKWASNLYILIASGDSMIDAHIYDGDYLIIQQQSDVNEWEIAVVIIWDTHEEKATLKRVYHKPSSLLLKPENNDFETMLLKQDSNAQIRWKLISVIRNY